MAIVWTGLVPHPPIIVEAVGGDRRGAVKTTIESMDSLCASLVNSLPERVIVISPHTPRPSQGIGSWCDGTMRGDFSRFGAPQARLQFAVDRDLMSRLAGAFPQIHGLQEPLDHGATVPLHFLAKAGWSGPTCVLGLPNEEDDQLEALGKAIAEAVAGPGRTALLASGDMSHCLLPESPCGFDQRGQLFDRTFVDFLRRAKYAEAAAIGRRLQEAAKQDVVASCRVVWAATDHRKQHHQFYSYEGPFGVGYAVMKFSAES